MQMGRRVESIHEMILIYLQNYAKCEGLEHDYIYEKVKGKIIYPSFEALGRAINSTLFFVAAPKIVTIKL